MLVQNMFMRQSAGVLS